MISRRSCYLVLLAILAIRDSAWSDEKILYEGESAYNTILVTEDGQGLRTLFFEKGAARQSVVKVGDPDHLELPYARAALVSLALVERPQRILVVGLGGGTIPSFLHSHYPQTEIDVVDIDPDVVDVAQKFFGFRQDATMRAYVADGRRFIEESRKPYDIIFLDAFGPDNIPYHLATREFLLAVRRSLTPKGVAVGNIWSRRSNPLHDRMVRTYQDVFDELYVLDVQGAGNKIFIALPRRQTIKREDLARRARAMSKARHFRFDMGDVVSFGFRHTEEMDTPGRILTDNK